MTDHPDRKRWNRIDRETSKAFDAFCCYRDQGPNRSIQRTAAELGKSLTPLRRWVTKWGWMERALAWDEHLQAVRDEAIESVEGAEAGRRQENIRRTTEFELEMSDAVAEKLIQMLRLPVIRQRRVEDSVNAFRKEGRGKKAKYIPEKIDTVVTIIEPAGWSFATMVAAMVEVSKLRRLATDLPTQTVKMDMLGFVRQKAEDQGLDPDEAVAMAEELIRQNQQ